MGTGPKQHQVAVRIDADMEGRIEAVREHFSKPWKETTRAEALRRIIDVGLKLVEQERRKAPKAGSISGEVSNPEADAAGAPAPAPASTPASLPPPDALVNPRASSDPS